MRQKTHGILEDVAAEIGYTATCLLVDWFGGIGQLYVPTEVNEDHPITKVIGVPAMNRLVKLFEGSDVHERFVWLNQNEQRDIARRDRLIAALLFMGLGAKQIGVLSGMSERHVFLARQRVERLGILPMILSRSGVRKLHIVPIENDELEESPDESYTENPGAKPRDKTQGQNPGAKTLLVWPCAMR